MSRRAAFAALAFGVAGLASPAATAAASAPFEAMRPVLSSPRCLNCHPAGNRPTQGEDLHPHVLNVQRGPADRGAPGLPCAECHGRTNNRFSGAPGAFDGPWRLAPAKLAWQGLSDAQLCRLLRDPKRNGGMSGPQLIRHMSSGFVTWAWSPGASASGRPRTPPPISHAAFVKATQAWVGAGQPCPGDAAK